MDQNILKHAFDVFRKDAADIPRMTLRGGSAVDGYDNPAPYDDKLDKPTDDYLEKFCFWGLTYLDAASWRHYLPHLIDYALRNLGAPGSKVIEGLLSSLRPPDKEPPRLATLSKEQEEVVVSFLNILAFDAQSAYRDYAMQVLEEYWIPDALYREQK